MKKGIDCIGVTVTFFCHDRNGNYLLNKRSVNCRDEHGCWDPGGGSVELGDQVVDTLIREIKEEYGTEVKEYEFLGYRDVHRQFEGKSTHWISLDFKVFVDRKTVRNAEPQKFDDIGWFRLDQLPDPLHSQLPNAVKIYQDKL